MAKTKQKSRKKDVVRKIKILKVEKVEDPAVVEPVHRVDLQLEVQGAEPPALSIERTNERVLVSIRDAGGEIFLLGWPGKVVSIQSGKKAA